MAIAGHLVELVDDATEERLATALMRAHCRDRRVCAVRGSAVGRCSEG